MYLEEDIEKSKKIISKLQDDDYALAMYAAFCNVTWIEDKTNQKWSISWRASGGLIARLRGKNESYIDFYCSGGEGKVSEEIEHDLAEIGWFIYRDDLPEGALMVFDIS